MNRFYRIVLAVSASAVAFAQDPTGEIAGTIYDASGAVIRACSINVQNIETGFARAIVSNQVGRYSAASLESGRYKLRVEANGFRTTVRDAVVASPTYRQDAAERLAAFVTHMEAKFGRHVAGYHPVGQNTGEALISRRSERRLPHPRKSHAAPRTPAAMLIVAIVP